MSDEQTAVLFRSSENGIEKQTDYDPASKTYTTCCAVCGKAKSQKKWFFRSRSAAMRKLCLEFNFCDNCGKWVCEDCFLVDDGNGSLLGICTACAKKRGISGLTSAQLEEAWPDIRRKIRARNEAVQRAVAREKLKGKK